MTDLAFLHDLMAFRFSPRGEPDVAAPQGGAMWPISTRVNKPRTPILLSSSRLRWNPRTGPSQPPARSRPPHLLRARQPHCRRTTLIVFYLISAILRGSLGRQPLCAREGSKLRGISRNSIAVALGRGGPYAAQGVVIMSRVIAVIACGFTLAACSTTMPSLDFMKSAPQSEMLAIESEPPGAEAKTSLGQSCRTPCQLAVQ